MVKYLGIAIAVFVAVAPGFPEGFDHTAWDGVLKAHVNVLGEVDYEALANDPSQLDAYVAEVAERSPDSHPDDFANDDAKLAYWLNAYNALTLRGVLGNYPIGSIREAGFMFAFFRRKNYTAGGATLSLNEIEHEIIRPRFGDPRIHFALVCASVSCPRLDREAFRGGSLDEHLDRLTRQFVAEPRNVRVSPNGKILTLSKILDWYGSDFEKATGKKGARGLCAFLEPYLSDEQRRRVANVAKPKTQFEDYDWGLNSIGSRSRSPNREERELAGRAGSKGRLAGS